MTEIYFGFLVSERPRDQAKKMWKYLNCFLTVIVKYWCYVIIGKIMGLASRLRVGEMQFFLHYKCVLGLKIK